MLVSIIIPIYNVAPYVEKCLRSVMAQTYRKLEVIIVDDCGTDNSMEIVGELLAENENSDMLFKILHHEKNRGLSAARNTGMQAATGDYIYFLDSDDQIAPYCLELMVERAKKYPKCQMVFAGAHVPNGKHRWLDYKHKFYLPEYSDNRDGLQKSMLKRYVLGMTAWNKLISRDFIVKHGLQFSEGLIHEDELWNFQIASYIQTACFIRQNTYLYNIRENSIVTAVNTDIKIKRLFILWNKMIAAISSYRREVQIKGICSYIIDETEKTFPHEHKFKLFLLYIKLAIKAHNSLSTYLTVQGFNALCRQDKYKKESIRNKITL